MTLHAGLLRDPMVNTGLYFKHAFVGDESATLLSLPTIYSGAISDVLSVDAMTTPAMAMSSTDESSIFRLAGTRVRASYVYKELLVGSLGLKLPTGTNQFTSGQLATAGNIGSRQLAFKNSNMFNSLDVCAGASSSLGFKDIGPGDLAVGLGLSYMFKAPYTPMDGMEESFDPADEFNASIASEYVFIALDRKITTMFDLGFTIYGSDQVGEGNEISAGGKFNWALFAAADVIDNLPASVRLANYKKGANSVDKQGETTKEASDIVFTLKSALPIAKLEQYQPFGSLTFASYSGGGVATAGDAFITTLGGGGSYRLSEHMFTNAELGLDFGSLKGGEDMGVFGIELAGNLAYKF